MNIEKKNLWPLLAILALIASSVMCSPDVDEATPTPTPTPTLTPAGEIATPAPVPTVTPTPAFGPPGDIATPAPTVASPCDSLSGAIEVKVLVGPAAAVGLEPFSVGSVDFSVSSGGAPYVVQGQGHIPYQDILVADWGTYDVTLDLDISISGECGDEGLVLELNLAGSQLLEVNAEGFHGEYPWQGEHTFNLVFPLVEGATAEGEGYIFVLHL